MTVNFRNLCLWVHRYTGLFMALFLFIAGISGALLAFNDELDNHFNRRLAYVEVNEIPPLPIAQLHDVVVDAYPQYSFSSFPVTVNPKQSVRFQVDRVRGKDAKTKPKPLFQEVYVNPYTGQIIGTRDKEKWAWENTMWKVFWLHRELLLGSIGKISLGIVALIWTINCFIGFYLTLPRAIKRGNNKKLSNYLKDSSIKKPIKKRASFFKRWLPAWKIRAKTNMFKFNLDVHQAFGLWLWVMLFVIAWSSVGFNLKQVYKPVMQVIVGSEVSEKEKLDSRKPADAKQNKADIEGKAQTTQKERISDSIHKPDLMIGKDKSIAALTKMAQQQADKHNLSVVNFESMRWKADDQQWQMRFITNKDIGKKGGASSITVSAVTGDIVTVNLGYQNTLSRKTDAWLSSLHMGHIGQGVGHRVYQIFLGMIGIAVAVLSVTGVYLWWRGRSSRRKQKWRKI